MKRIHMISIIFSLITTFTFFGCDKEDTPIPEPTKDNQIKISIGSHTFTATLYDNAAATAFKNLLPMTINMTEMNGNEKYYDLPNALPTNSSNPGKIQNGDLMLYGSRTLVLFYKSFNTSYRYTKLGRVNDAFGLQNALGSGNVTVTFEKL